MYFKTLIASLFICYLYLNTFLHPVGLPGFHRTTVILVHKNSAYRGRFRYFALHFILL